MKFGKETGSWSRAKVLAVVCLPVVAIGLSGCAQEAQQPELAARSKPILERDGHQFRDLDGDGALTPYEDWRLSPEERTADLLERMSVEEKVGTLMHSTLPGRDGEMGVAQVYDLDALGELVKGKHVTSFITRLSLEPIVLAEQNNAVQELAEASRLGIPITISTDPRNHFQYVLGASSSALGNTQWPELLGFAALRDPDRVRHFARIGRREYRAVGIHMALSPQLDLATEPRWARMSGTFGSNPQLTSDLGAAYVEGFQGGANGLAPDGVMTVVKHWVGYGAQPEGFDGHNYYGRFAMPGDSLNLHVDAFRGALNAQAAGVMPAYPIPVGASYDGEPIEEVSPGYSKQLLEGLLRGELGFGGIVLSDWAITRDCNDRCRNPTDDAPQRPQDISTAWGVEDLTVQERYVKGLEAGLDQFGGTDDVAPLLAALKAGEIAQERLDLSVARVLLPKFVMGLFENPYVDPRAAVAATGNGDDFALAAQTQREAHVLLRNESAACPSHMAVKVWLFGVSADAAREAGLEVV
uniref:beta-glucosidase n=1 Tax=uncultured microorganism TaxID=358574 RepID=U5YBI2_9ZZZZ|nr:beta-glucosidase MgSY-1 [uncultured microorganism]